MEENQEEITPEQQAIMDKINSDANIIALNLLPMKSRDKYLKVFGKFASWKKVKNIDENCFSESTLLVYFDSLAVKYKSSTLWTEYSMVRSVIESNYNVDMKSYNKLVAYLKRNSIGYRPKQAMVFESEHIRRFLEEADNRHYLLMKVVMVFGVYGATRGDELTKMLTNHVRAEGNVFIVIIPQTKTDKGRCFTIEQDSQYVREYIKLRPANMPHMIFFVNYQLGECTIQPIGRNKFYKTPKLIAEYLNLEDAGTYTGHSFRRTSATLLANSGANLLEMKRHAGWRSNSVVERYIEESVNNKRKISDKIAGEISKNRKVLSSNGEASSSGLVLSQPVQRSVGSASTLDVGNASSSGLVLSQSVQRSVRLASTSDVDNASSSGLVLSQSMQQSVELIATSDMEKSLRIVKGMQMYASNNITVNFNFGK